MIQQIRWRDKFQTYKYLSRWKEEETGNDENQNKICTQSDRENACRKFTFCIV